jgi:hypothetical protein
MGMGFKIKYKPESKILIAAATQNRPRCVFKEGSVDRIGPLE